MAYNTTGVIFDIWRMFYRMILRSNLTNVEMIAMFGTQQVTDKHYLFPIPQSEIDSNLGLGVIENGWN